MWQVKMFFLFMKGGFEMKKILKKFVAVSLCAGTFILSPISHNVVSANYYDAGYNMGSAIGSGLFLQMEVSRKLKKIQNSETARKILYDHFREQLGVNCPQ